MNHEDWIKYIMWDIVQNWDNVPPEFKEIDKMIGDSFKQYNILPEEFYDVDYSICEVYK